MSPGHALGGLDERPEIGKKVKELKLLNYQTFQLSVDSLDLLFRIVSSSHPWHSRSSALPPRFHVFSSRGWAAGMLSCGACEKSMAHFALMPSGSDVSCQSQAQSQAVEALWKLLPSYG